MGERVGILSRISDLSKIAGAHAKEDLAVIFKQYKIRLTKWGANVLVQRLLGVVKSFNNNWVESPVFKSFYKSLKCRVALMSKSTKEILMYRSREDGIKSYDFKPNDTPHKTFPKGVKEQVDVIENLMAKDIGRKIDELKTACKEKIKLELVDLLKSILLKNDEREGLLAKANISNNLDIDVMNKVKISVNVDRLSERSISEFLKNPNQWEQSMKQLMNFVSEILKYDSNEYVSKVNEGYKGLLGDGVVLLTKIENSSADNRKDNKIPNS